MTSPCVFCDIVSGQAPAEVVRLWGDAMAIVPLNPVVDGHVLVIPNRHVRDALEEPAVTGLVMTHAAELAAVSDWRPCNLITSVGAAATQSVWHLHVHVVPRRLHDGLMLPWGDNEERT